MHCLVMADSWSRCPGPRPVERRDRIGVPKLGCHVLYAAVPGPGKAYSNRQLDLRYVNRTTGKFRLMLGS